MREWLGAESNRRHVDFQSTALPTELPSREIDNRRRAGRSLCKILVVGQAHRLPRLWQAPRLLYNFKHRVVGCADERDSDGPAVRPYPKISRRILSAIPPLCEQAGVTGPRKLRPGRGCPRNTRIDTKRFADFPFSDFSRGSWG